MSEPVKLHLGCGHTHLDGWVNVDQYPAPEVDVVCDITKPLHFWAPNSVDEVLISHTLEHLPLWENTVMEIHRVLRPGGILTIRVPYGLDPYTGHCRSFYPCTLDGFIAETVDKCRGFDAGPLFHRVSREYSWSVPGRWHLNHYILRHFKVALPQYGRVGVKRTQITWVLQKLEASARPIAPVEVRS